MFKKPKGELSRQIYLLIDGPESSRKTTIGLQAPGPLGVLDLNKGLDIPEFYQQSNNGSVLTVSRIPLPRGENKQKSAVESRDLFYKDVMESIESNRFTLVDTGTNVWEIARIADMGCLTVKEIDDEKQQKYGRLNYDAPNSFMREWLFFPYETGNNLIITAHQGEQYRGNRPTGNIIPRGFKECPEIVRQHIRVDKEFNCEILKCRSNQAAVGEVLQCPSFVDLACMFFPDSEPDDWS